MTEQEARFILQSYRPGLEDDVPEVGEALQMAKQNPALAEWLAEEEAFDRAIATHLEAIPPPFGLKTRILAQGSPAAIEPRRWSWAVKLAGVVALLFLVAQVANFFRTTEPISANAGDYASEMVSFIKLSPPLEMGSDDLGTIENYLAKKETAPLDIPPQLAALEPLGCRVLSFRGQKVALICFQRKVDGLAHLFVVSRAAMPRMKPGDKPVFAQEGEWATASWAEKGAVYMIAAKGKAADVERYLPST